MAQKLTLPINNCRLTASYKNAEYKRETTYTHYGIDMRDKDWADTTLYASGIGTLIAKGWDYYAGNVVVVKYPQAYNRATGRYQDVIFRYFHMDSINANIPTGTNKITKDTILGYYGGSGFGQMDRWDPHLHLEADTDTAYPCYSPTFSVSGEIIKGTNAGATDATTSSATKWLYVKDTHPDNQKYSYNATCINEDDNSLPIWS